LTDDKENKNKRTREYITGTSKYAELNPVTKETKVFEKTNKVVETIPISSTRNKGFISFNI